METSALKNVSAVSQQDLLRHIAETAPETVVRITSLSASSHLGIIASFGSVRNNEYFLVLQIMDERSGLLNRHLHIPLSRIESVEVVGASDVSRIFSLGKSISSESYDESGKLDVKREFMIFSEAISAAAGVKIGMPVMELPDDAKALNRIVKLTRKIQQALVEIFQEEDAKASWNKQFCQVTFVQQDAFEIKADEDSMTIGFPFATLTVPEFSGSELTNRILKVL